MNFVLKKFQFSFFLAILALSSKAQMNIGLPFSEIPDPPKKYTATSVVARMVEGVGFRYYWGTEGLRPEDLDYKPSKDSRTCRETLDHIYGLSQTILSAAKKRVNNYDESKNYDFEILRSKTLNKLKEAADIFRADAEGSLDDYQIIFQRGESQSTYPFWNMVNGPIEDAAWHVGQVVSFRRSSGNPINPKASFFSGKLK
jgi:hypothetical protein